MEELCGQLSGSKIWDAHENWVQLQLDEMAMRRYVFHGESMDSHLPIVHRAKRYILLEMCSSMRSLLMCALQHADNAFVFSCIMLHFTDLVRNQIG